MLEIVITGAAGLVSTVGGLLTYQMRSSSTQAEASQKALVEQAQASEASQQRMMETVLSFASEVKKGTDTFKAYPPPNGGHAQTREMLRDQKAAFNSFGEKLDRMIANQEARTDIVETLLSKMSEERFCKYSNEDLRKLRRG